MSFCYRNRDGAEREFAEGEVVPAGWAPRTKFKAWRAAGFPTNPPDLDGDGVPGGRLSKAEIMADLDMLDIKYDARWSRDRLDALLRKDKPAREAAIKASLKE
jgi:hypothetical protein